MCHEQRNLLLYNLCILCNPTLTGLINFVNYSTVCFSCCRSESGSLVKFLHDGSVYSMVPFVWSLTVESLVPFIWRITVSGFLHMFICREGSFKFGGHIFGVWRGTPFHLYK